MHSNSILPTCLATRTLRRAMAIETAHLTKTVKFSIRTVTYWSDFYDKATETLNLGSMRRKLFFICKSVIESSFRKTVHKVIFKSERRVLR